MAIAGIGQNGVVTTDREVQTFTPSMRLSEVKLFMETSVLNPPFSTVVQNNVTEGIATHTLIFSVLGMMLLCCCIGAALLGFALRLRKKIKYHEMLSEKLTDLGFSLENLPSPESVRRRGMQPATPDIEDTFLEYDEDGSMGIDQTELQSLLVSRGYHLADRYIDGMWSTFDTDGDGQLDVLEFNALM